MQIEIDSRHNERVVQYAKAESQRLNEIKRARRDSQLST
jgi:hypothetical protein